MNFKSLMKVYDIILEILSTQHIQTVSTKTLGTLHARADPGQECTIIMDIKNILKKELF